MALNQYVEWLNGGMSGTLVMGILNITPDSFSDGNLYLDPEMATNKALLMVSQGAHIIDLGGESTRPGAQPVSLDEELSRIMPVIKGIRAKSNVMISIDTTKSVVAQNALEAGADIVNDISGLTFDESMVKIVEKFKAPVVIMHIKGTPKNMQNDIKYNDLLTDLFDYFQERIEFATSNGISDEQIIIDPGIGFGKNVNDNYTIINNLSEFKKFGYPILIGPSRKSFIGSVLNKPADQRLYGTAAAVTASILNGANIIRVHDIDEMSQIALISDKIKGSS